MGKILMEASPPISWPALLRLEGESDLMVVDSWEEWVRDTDLSGWDEPGILVASDGEVFDLVFESNPRLHVFLGSTPGFQRPVSTGHRMNVQGGSIPKGVLRVGLEIRRGLCGLVIGDAIGGIEIRFQRRRMATQRAETVLLGVEPASMDGSMPASSRRMCSMTGASRAGQRAA